jgi:hypothetical protein
MLATQVPITANTITANIDSVPCGFVLTNSETLEVDRYIPQGTAAMSNEMAVI